MTKTEARKTLGITSSANRSKTKLIYEEKSKKLRLQMVPGMPEATRHKAYGELARLSTAWQTLQTTPATRCRRKKKTHRKSPTHKPVSASCSQRPQNLGEVWGEFVSLMPFSEPVVLMISILIPLLILTLLLMRVL